MVTELAFGTSIGSAVASARSRTHPRTTKTISRTKRISRLDASSMITECILIHKKHVKLYVDVLGIAVGPF